MRNSIAILMVLMYFLLLSSVSWAMFPVDQDSPPIPVTDDWNHTVPIVDNPACPSDSIGYVLGVSNDLQVSVAHKIVIADPSDTGGNFFYIQEQDRSAGIRVNCPTAPSVSRGYTVTVSGIVKTDSSTGERYIDASQESIVVDSVSGLIAAPLMMDSTCLGGASIGDSTGITQTYTPSPGIRLGNGAYNKGLLVRIWGYVTTVNATAHWFYVDDGACYSDDLVAGVSGVRVQAASGNDLPPLSGFVLVTGVSCSLKNASGNTVPLIRTRNVVSDITVVSQKHLTDPDHDDGEVVDLVAPTDSDRVIHAPGTTPWSMISVPGIPLWSQDSMYRPVAGYVFSETIQYCDEILWLDRWDSLMVPCYPAPYVSYPDDPYWWPTVFGPIYPGQGYWIDCIMDGTLSYHAVIGPPNLPPCDAYIKLPKAAFSGNAYSGLSLIGYPFTTPQALEKVRVTDGQRVLSYSDAKANHWLSDSLHYYNYKYHVNDPEYFDIGLAGSSPAPDDTNLKPWHGYWIRAFKPHLALIIPNPSTFLTLATTPTSREMCDSTGIEIEATLRVHDVPDLTDVPVTFHTTKGSFTGSAGQNSITIPTVAGVAVATLLRASACEYARVEVTAQANATGLIIGAAPVVVTFKGWTLSLSTTSTTVYAPCRVGVQAKLTYSDGTTTSDVTNQQVTLTTDYGAFVSSGDSSYSPYTDSAGNISADLTVNDYPATVTVTGTTSSCVPPSPCSGSVQFATAGDDWPMFMHDMHHTGHTTVDDTETQKTLYLRWIGSVPTAQTWLSRYYDLLTSGMELPGFDMVPHFSAVSKKAHPVFDSSPVHYGWGDSADGAVLVGTYEGSYPDRVWVDVTDPQNPLHPGYWIGCLYPDHSTGQLLAFDPTSISSRDASDRMQPADPVWKFPADNDDPNHVGGIAGAPVVTKIGTGADAEPLIIFGCEGDGSGTGTGRIYGIYGSNKSGQNHRGRQKWVYPAVGSQETIGKIMCSSPVVSNGIVYIGTESGELVALHVEDGAEAFDTVDLVQHSPHKDKILAGEAPNCMRPYVGTSSPMVEPVEGMEYVFIGMDDGCIYKVPGYNQDMTAQQRTALVCVYNADGSTGSDDADSIEGSPSFLNGHIYAAIAKQAEYGDNLFCLNTDLGSVWSAHAYYELATTPALNSNGVFIGDETGHIFYRFALGLQSPQQLASFPFEAAAHIFSSAAVTSTLAFVGNDMGKLSALDQANLTLGNRLTLTDILSDQREVTINSLAQMESDPNTPAWISSSPALSYSVDSTGSLYLFVTARTGKIYCFGPKPEIE